MHRLGQNGVCQIGIPTSWNIKFNLCIGVSVLIEMVHKAYGKIIYVFIHILRLREQVVLTLYTKKNPI